MEKSELLKLQKLLTKLEKRTKPTGARNVEFSPGDLYLFECVYHLDFIPGKALVGLDEKQFEAVTKGFLEIYDDFSAKYPEVARPSIKTWDEHLAWEAERGASFVEKTAGGACNTKEGGKTNGKGKERA